MSGEQLYRRVMKGKRVTYEPYVEQNEETSVVTFTDSQCITAAGALGMTLLMVFERNIPPHKKIARKIKAVEDAIFDLFAGCGEPIDPDMAQLMCSTWDRVMKELTA